MLINADDYKPKQKGRSDKFSWNLYTVLKEYEKHDLQVINFAWNAATGHCDLDNGTLYLCVSNHNDDFPLMGSIVRITCFKGKEMSCLAGMDGIHPSRITKEDVTDWFFREYARKGKCIIHGDSAHEWISINRNSRKCKYCGQHERRTVVKKQQTKRKELWKC